MADPLSVAGSIAGLVSLGDTVFRGIYRYVKTVKNAEKEVLDLKNVITDLTGIFHNLKIVAHELEQDANFDNSIRVDHVNSCLATLYKLNDKLKKIEYPKDQKIRTGLRKLTWPYKSGETKDLCVEIRKHREVLALALSADTTTALLKCLSSQDAMAANINDMRDIIRKREEVETRIMINESRRRVLQYFGVVNPRENYKTSLSLRHPSTGFWLIEGDTFRAWLRDRGSRLWLTGIPGAGKTVLSGLIVEECIARSTNDRAVAYYYCDYKNAQSQSAVNIFGSIGVQLANQHEGSYNLLEKYYKSLHPPNQLERRPEVKELVTLLQEMASSFEDIRLVIDGLDECGDSAEENSEWLKALACEGQDSISLAVLSRDEPKIRDFLGPICTHIEVAAQTKDIEHFVRTTIEERISKKSLRVKNPELKDEIIKSLVSKAQGMFRWVSCQLDHLCELSTDAQRRKALHELPKTLNETYERILGRVKPHDIPLVRRILLWTTYASPKLKISALLEVVAIEEDDDRIDPEARVDEEQVLQFCSSLIRKRHDFFELAHFSVQEYLEKIGDVNLIDYQYHTNPRLHLAKACLRFLCLSDFDRPPPVTAEEMEEVISQHAFLESATMTWLDYAGSNLEHVGLYGQIQCLFQPKRSYNFMIYAVVMLRGLHEECYDCFEDQANFSTDLQKTIEMATSGDFGPLHVAALLGLPEICEWLLAEGYDVNQGSPFGSPIECSVFGPFCSVWRYLGYRDDIDTRTVQDSIDEMGKGMQEKTIVALLSAGGNCKMTVPGGIPLWSAGLSISKSKNYGPLFSILVKHGMPVQEDTMQELQMVEDKNIFEPLLQVIQDVKDLSITTEQRDEIRTLGIQMGIGTVSSLLRGESISLKQLSNLAEHAISYDQLDIIQPLFEHPAFAMDMELPGIDGTILHLAARRHSVKVMHALLDLGFEPSRPDSQGRTVLQESATLQNDSIMRRLVENPKCIRPDNDGRTVWHEAARSGTSRTLELLIEQYGTSCPDIHLVSAHGRTPLLEAVISGNETTSLLLLGLTQEIDRAVMDWKLGYYCVSHGLSKVLQKLIQSGVNLALYFESQQSALHFLTIKTPIHLLESLLENGMDPDEQDLNGKSAIHTFLDGSRHTELAWAELGLGMDVDYLPSEILEKLVTPEGAVLKDRHGFVPWYYYCTKYVTRVLAVCTHREHQYGPVSQDARKALAGFVDVGQELVKKGALAGFDGENKIQSALSLLVENCLNTVKQPPEVRATLQATFKAIAKLLVHILDDLALSTPATGSAQFTRLLIWAIQNREDVLSKVLLDYGADVHARSNFYHGHNAIETVCFITDVGQDMFETVLQYAKVDALNEKDWAGKSPIHYLCEQAWKDRKEILGKLNILLKFGVDPNARSGVNQITPVHIVALKGDVEAFRSLIQHRASVHLYSQYGWGVVLYAILSNSIDMVNELVEKIDDSEQWKRKVFMSAPWDRNSNLSGCSAFHIAATVSKDMLELLAGSGHYEDIHETNDDGYTPLHLASASHHGATTEWLISHGANFDAATTNGMTALHLALSSGNLSALKALVEAGAQFKADKMGRTPESVVPAHQLTEVLHLLQDLKVSDHVLQNLRKYKDTQDIFSAIRSGHLDSCRMIMEKGKSWQTAQSPECNTCTALGLALIEEKWDIMDLLLENGVTLGGPVCAKQFPCIYPYMSVIHVAVAKPAYNSRLQRLLEISLTHQDHWVWDSLNLFHVAAYYNPPSIDILISHVRKNQDILIQGLKIQQLSSTEGELDVVGHLINTPITAGLYLAGGLIFHPGSTSLHVAAWTRRPGLIEKLISNGAKPNVQNSVGRTPLHFAADIGCKDSVRALLDNGAIATLQDSSLMTPLMITCSNGSIPTVQLLTVHEHGRHIIDAHGQSALHHSAKSAGFQAFIHLLEAGWDPYQTDTVGRSSINLALGDRIFLTYILNADLDLEHLMPKGAHSIFYGNAHLLRLFLRRFPEEYRQRLVNHKHTIWEPPLCYAARCTDIVSMEVMIGAGANIEIQDAMGRTALIFACLAGCLDPVKLLVRNGAKLQYNVMGQSVSAFEAAHNHEKITTWLLVLRHTEYRRISNVDHTEGRSLKYWSGVRQLEIPLEGYFSRKLGQSRWDWVRSIHDRKESWRTMVPLDWDPASHIAPLFVRPKYSLDRDTV